MSERAIQSRILLFVGSLQGGLFWRQNTGTAQTAAGAWVKFSVPGCPDILGCYRGRMIGIEVKTATGRQSEQQRNFQAAMERAGGLYLLARSVDDVSTALSKLA